MQLLVKVVFEKPQGAGGGVGVGVVVVDEEVGEVEVVGVVDVVGDVVHEFGAYGQIPAHWHSCRQFPSCRLIFLELQRMSSQAQKLRQSSLRPLPNPHRDGGGVGDGLQPGGVLVVLVVHTELVAEG